MYRLHALASEGKTPEELAQFLNEDPELESVHGQFATMGQSNIDENTSFHFVAYVNVDGMIWEIDGRRSQPLQKGECAAQEEFGPKIASLLKGYARYFYDQKNEIIINDLDQVSCTFI